MKTVFILCAVLLGCFVAFPQVVSHIKVLSDKVEDVSNLEAWKKSFIKDDMTDEQKAIAVWRSNVAFVYQDIPPNEKLHEDCVHDAIKSFNVYGYGMCCCASARMEQLARYLGFPARGWGLNSHSVPEVFWDGEWHTLDASLVNYFTRPDGKIASVKDICDAVQKWLAEHPNYKSKNAKLVEFQKSNGWTGWKNGPPLLANCKFYDWAGWFPAKTHGWASTMQEYDGRNNTPFLYEYGYSQGYEVNIQLRPGERLTRNWFNKGQHINDGKPPACLTEKVNKFLRDYNDKTDCRVGSGTLEYDVPKRLLETDTIEIEMPCSYVYLNGKLTLNANPGAKILFSDNNGLDWREIATLEKSGLQEIDLTSFCRRRYDYRLRIIRNGATVSAVKITHDIQCSQRALPILSQGENTITFIVGAQEGSVTIEGSSQGGNRFSPLKFHPVLKDVEEQYFRIKADGGSITFPVETPGDIVRLRFGGFYRLRDKQDQWEMQVSFDGGKTFNPVATQTGPYQGICQYLTVTNIPPNTRAAQVRWVGKQRNTTCLFFLRIDADYKQPQGGFAPIKITYTWEEDGVEKKDIHIAKSPNEVYKITCKTKPTMKSIALELL